MPQSFNPGDFLVFQLEAGFGLLRVLSIETNGGDPIWHLAAYRDLFPDIDAVESASAAPDRLSISDPHLALTNRAFESTQVAKIANAPLTENELKPFLEWQTGSDRQVSDRSVRLMLGLR